MVEGEEDCQKHIDLIQFHKRFHIFEGIKNGGSFQHPKTDMRKGRCCFYLKSNIFRPSPMNSQPKKLSIMVNIEAICRASCV